MYILLIICFNETMLAFIGYMLNVVTGDHYKFVSWGIGRGSYLVSLTLMFLFVSMKNYSFYIQEKYLCEFFSVFVCVLFTRRFYFDRFL